ncbi:cytochrome P450 [Novosphingobium sp.]|uniref:cytochrome P450 n=1 Tax=Novosphingobium sp. TaxID=1874826 RepID=UPI003342154B
MATTAPDATRAINPFDVSQNALYTDDTWREPFARLRAKMPVSWCPQSPFGAYWSVVTHAPVMEVELAPQVFSSSHALGNITIADTPPETSLANFIAMDAPGHTEQRKVVAPAFSPSQMVKADALVRQRTHELIARLPVGETFCWVNDVAIPLTIGMLCVLFDFPWDERADLKLWSDWASNVQPDRDADYNQRFLAEMQRMLVRFDALMDDRRQRPPSDDLLSRMVHSTAMGNLNPFERISNLALLVVAGNDTTRNSMAGLVEALARYPAQLDILRADPSLIANAAQEIVRWQSPVTHMRRTATADYTLHGQTIRAGEKVVMWYISANRDETVFADAERFDVTRDNARRHLGFGHGSHRCVGARLAEVQLATLIEELVSQRIRVVPQGEPTRLASSFLHGFTQMPVQIIRE